MSIIKYKHRCRFCGHLNKFEGFTMDNQHDFAYYDKLTEYEISQIIEKSLESNEIKCEHCQSNNWDLTKIRVDDIQIFNYNELKSRYKDKGKYLHTYIWSYKNGQPNLIVDNGETGSNAWEDIHRFNLKCKDFIKNHIEQIPDSRLIQHHQGYFHMCFAGTDDEIHLEKLRYVGFDKKQLIYITDNVK